MIASRTLRACAALLVATACVAPAPAGTPPTPAISTWGTMREALREGRSEPRVALQGMGTPGAVGVGALAGLAGEVTVIDGRVLVATAPATPTDACEVREADASDHAALLVLAVVPAWEEHEIGPAPSYESLEAAIAEVLHDRGLDPASPIPVRIRGEANDLSLHVLAGACPHADPGGAPPWRWSGPSDDVEFVGFFAEDAAGRLTHHARRSHLHAVAGRVMGHLDDVVLERAVLRIPAR
jgi:hypothetical protein